MRSAEVFAGRRHRPQRGWVARVGLGASLALVALGVQSQTDIPPITVHFSTRPPYLMALVDGSPDGITGSVAKAAFRAAKLPVRWNETPTSRQLLLIETNAGRDCGIGWFKNPQREQFARFTSPIYRDQPWALLAGPHVKLPNSTNLAQVFGGSESKLLVKDKYSYGAELDRRIAQFSGELVKTTGDWLQIIGMLSLARADFTFAAQEEAEHVAASEKGLAGRLKVVTVSDAPPGEYRYLMCSRQVTEAEVAALNAALAGLAKPGH